MLDLVVAVHTRSFANELVGVIVETPGSLAQRLGRQIDTLSEEALVAIDGHLPLQSLSLMDLSLRLADRRASLARNLVFEIDGRRCVRSEQRRCRFLATLPLALARSECASPTWVGGRRRWRRARRRSRSTGSSRRRRPDAFLPDLATSLNNLGIRLSDLGRREEALAASQEAVETLPASSRRRGPTPSSPTSPGSLNNLGISLSDLGRREEALAASQEAVEILPASWRRRGPTPSSPTSP